MRLQQPSSCCISKQSKSILFLECPEDSSGITRLETSTSLRSVVFIVLGIRRRQRRAICFLDALDQARRRNRFVVAGWVVMPERVHLFMGEPLEGTVANAMHGLKLSVTLRRTGRPFRQARYFAFPGFGCGVGL